jgi:hypothetical protein
MVRFISYNGAYPNLCSGELVLEIDGAVVPFPQYCMRSGGSVSFTDDWEEVVTEGKWTVEVPEQYKQYEREINRVVNANVDFGCCGGCV